MPRGDRTGPEGMGPMTGRGMGYCAGYDAPGYVQPGYGRGYGRGYGYGRGLGYGRGFRGGRGGWRNARYGAPVPYGYPPAWDIPPVAPRWTADDEVAALKQQADMLQASLAEITRRIEDLTQTDE
jgi:hypothetical protein